MNYIVMIVSHKSIISFECEIKTRVLFLQFPKTKGNAITCTLDIYLDIFHTAIELYQDYFSYQTRHYHYY